MFLQRTAQISNIDEQKSMSCDTALEFVINDRDRNIVQGDGKKYEKVS